MFILLQQLQTFDVSDLMQNLSINEKLANINYQRYQKWESANPPYSAISLYKGEAFKYLASEKWTAEELVYAQENLLIFSALYGLLRPLDAIQPHRLEMTDKAHLPHNQSLYAFWRNELTAYLAQKLNEKQSFCLNLASNEYYRILDSKQDSIKSVVPVFKQLRNEKYVSISTLAKQARGMMASYCVTHAIETVDEIKKFDRAGYRYMEKESTADELHFYQMP